MQHGLNETHTQAWDMSMHYAVDKSNRKKNFLNNCWLLKHICIYIEIRTNPALTIALDRANMKSTL